MTDFFTGGSRGPSETISQSSGTGPGSQDRGRQHHVEAEGVRPQVEAQVRLGRQSDDVARKGNPQRKS